MSHSIWTRLLAMLVIAATLSPVCAQDTSDQAQEPSANEAPAQTELAAEEALAGIEGLEDADARISGGVVTISGTADDASVLEEAEQAVLAATGATRVNNEIELSLDLQDRTRGAAHRVSERVEDWVAYLPVIPVAIAVLLVFALLAWLIGKLRWPFSHFTRNPFLQDIIRKVTQSGVLLMGVLLALEILDAMALVGGVLGAAGVAGIAIGFAFKDLIENYIASILLSLRQPFRPKDHVVIDGHEGLVTAMNSRSTVLTTFDGNVVRIPNAVVFKTTLINYTSDRRRRFNFSAGVGYDVNLPQAIDIGVQTLLDTEGVMHDPKPTAIVSKLGDSSITVDLYGWVDQEASNFGKVRSNAMQNVKAQFDKFNIDMPEPIYKIRIEGNTPPETEAPPPAEPAPMPEHHDETAKGDIRRDDTIEDMVNESAQQGADNLLSKDAPAE
ncbi:MAG: mechanosensitive ion channel domain-containing protein [Phycisphaerales bacterium]